jgi:hypothetical protein
MVRAVIGYEAYAQDLEYFFAIIKGIRYIFLRARYWWYCHKQTDPSQYRFLCKELSEFYYSILICDTHISLSAGSCVVDGGTFDATWSCDLISYVLFSEPALK